MPPPNLLKRKIIIKNKKKHHHHHHKKKIINIIPTPVVPPDLLVPTEENKNPSSTGDDKSPVIGDESVKSQSTNGEEATRNPSVICEEASLRVTANGETPVSHAPPLKESSKERYVK